MGCATPRIRHMHIDITRRLELSYRALSSIFVLARRLDTQTLLHLTGPMHNRPLSMPTVAVNANMPAPSPSHGNSDSQCQLATNMPLPSSREMALSSSDVSRHACKTICSANVANQVPKDYELTLLLQISDRTLLQPFHATEIPYSKGYL